MVHEKEALEHQIMETTQRLNRATKLIGGLGGERTRWSQRSKELAEQYRCLVGDVTIAAAIITYLGPFSQTYRAEACADWLRTAKGVKDGLKITPRADFGLQRVLYARLWNSNSAQHACSHRAASLCPACCRGDPIRIDEWKLHGLPADAFSLDSAVIMSRARHPPLFIDPQSTATRWIRRLEKARGLRLLRLTDADYTRVLESAVSSGVPVLCESMGEHVDPTLETLIEGVRPTIAHRWRRQRAPWRRQWALWRRQWTLCRRPHHHLFPVAARHRRGLASHFCT